MSEESKGLVQRHAEGVTHNTAGSIISNYIVQGAPSVISWITAHAAYIRGLELHWAILLALVVFALAAFTVNQLRQAWTRSTVPQLDSTPEPHQLTEADHKDCERQIRNLESTITRLQHNDQTQGIQISARDSQIEQLQAKLKELNACPYELVHRLADHQAKVIRDFVTVSRVAVWEHNLNDPVPTIKWGFMIKNRSLFPINLVEVRKNLFFEKIELAERRFEDVNEVQQLTTWREGSVVFEQRLSGPEAQFIKNTPDGKFRFNRLIIKVGNPNNFPPIEPQELEIGDDLEATLNEITYKETKGMVRLKNERDRLKDELEKAKGADAKLTFEIDKDQSQVHATGGGTAGRRISANIRLRCMKFADRPMAIREFHAALLKEDGPEQTIVPQETTLVVMGHPDMKIIDFTNGWTIAEPLTDYRWFMFYLDITEQQLQLLSSVYFMRVTMVAVGQKPYSVDFDVDNWEHARQSNSYITVREKGA